MGSRLQRLLLISLCALCYQAFSQPEDDTTPNGAEQTVEDIISPDLKRRKVKESDIDSENFEIGFFGGLMSTGDFGTNGVFGARFAYHVTESFFLEAAYGQSTTRETSFEKLSGSAELLTEDQRELTYYNLSIGWNIMPGESFIGKNIAKNSDLYLIAGAGSTDFAGSTAFTYNFGFGYRLLLTDWFAWHLDFRDHIFEIDVFGEEETVNHLEFHSGFTIFF